MKLEGKGLKLDIELKKIVEAGRQTILPVSTIFSHRPAAFRFANSNRTATPEILCRNWLDQGREAQPLAKICHVQYLCT